MKKALFVALLWIVFCPAAEAALKSKIVPYEFGGVTMKGYLAWDDSFEGRRPGVLVFHEFWGLNDYAKKRADQLAGMGYRALAADMFGEGKMSDHPEEASAMMAQVKSNLALWVGRANAALAELKMAEGVDPTRVAAIGYCFGGATALQLAYSGANILAAISFHGALPIPETTKDIKAKLLILNGADDTFITAETIQKLKAVLDKGGVNYKFINYPGAVHSFTVPDADRRGMKGAAYNAAADKQSWEEMDKLLKQVFAGK